MDFPFEIPSKFEEPDNTFLNQYRKIPKHLQNNYKRLLNEFRDGAITPGRRLEKIGPNLFSARLNRKYRFVYELIEKDQEIIGRPLVVDKHDEAYDQANRL